MNVHRIAFTGAAGSGKSTCARYLARKYNFHRLSFANALKDICQELFGLGDLVIKSDRERQLLQKFGVMVRELDEDAWLRPIAEQLSRGVPDDSYVLDDCRFNNEAKFLKDNGFKIIQLKRERRILEGDVAAHESERGIAPEFLDQTIFSDSVSGLLTAVAGLLDLTGSRLGGKVDSSPDQSTGLSRDIKRVWQS